MRIWDYKGFIPFQLEALTPVHIGSGWDLSPLEYVLRQPLENRYEVWLIDTAAWLADNQANPEIDRALDAGGMEALRQLLNGCPTLEAHILARIRVASPQLGKQLLQKRNSIGNKAEIMPFARNPFTHMPYVPASSLKGAIVTALTDYLNEKRKGKKPALRDAHADCKGILRDMFGQIGEHAMQALRMADIALPPGMTSIREAIGVSLKPGKELKTPCEALDPGASQGHAYGNMRLDSASGRPCLTLPDRSRISLAELGRVCNAFYKKRFKAEFDRFYTKPHFGETRQLLAPICGRIDNIDEDHEILLRIGRYSHIECVTVSGSPPPMPKGYGATRTMADRKMPFGWVILKQCGIETYARGLAAVDGAIRKEWGDKAAAAQQARQKQQEEDARKRKEEEAEKQRQEELAALCPNERAIWELDQPTATENQAVTVFNKLSEFGDLQNSAAEALMRFWQRLGKWEGKQLTKKQKEKVAAVRAILQR